MAQNPLAPPPQGKDPVQDRWLYLLWKRISSSGQVLWSYLDFSGSDLANIETRNHEDLQNLNTSSYTHLTETQAAELTDGGVTALHSHAGGGGGIPENIISVNTNVLADTSYIVSDYLTVDASFNVDGNVGIL